MSAKPNSAYDPSALTVRLVGSASEVPTTFYAFTSGAGWQRSGATRSIMHDALFRYGKDVELHQSLLVQSGISATGLTPLWYVSVPGQPSRSPNSSDSEISLAAQAYYQEAESQLKELESEADDPDAPVEKGAISTALAVIDQLRDHQIAPPELTWHGGDAVVMLWALGTTTYAITVTDGELGYVVRRDRKQLRMSHSVSLKDFKVLELR